MQQATMIEIPGFLADRLRGSEYETSIRSLADRVAVILRDNKTHFFPHYTDHGVEHVNGVLSSAVDLIPRDVRNDPGATFTEVDAAILVGATLLHDIAMHLQPKGLLELVGPKSRFEPIPWFDQDHASHTPDRPWPDLWADFLREARRFSDRDLTPIVGEQAAREWSFDDLPDDPGSWNHNHNLVVGEFIRRHHARLAHEIAIHGFPGLDAGSGEGSFPAMGRDPDHPLRRLADLIGLVARSHGLPLRVCQNYLEGCGRHPDRDRPMGSAILYPMALLRVADYLQIDHRRAPAVLLNLRDPQSPISVAEWRKHASVSHVQSEEGRRRVSVTVEDRVPLSMYLQLRDLRARLQSEMDKTTAVLDEAYGNRTKDGLDRLSLAVRRVVSNLDDPAFRDRLPYVPERVGFSADPQSR